MQKIFSIVEGSNRGCIFPGTVLLIYFSCQNIMVKALASRPMTPSSMPKSTAPRWCHVASMSIVTLNRITKLNTMTYGIEMCYLGADPLVQRRNLFLQSLNVIFFKKRSKCKKYGSLARRAYHSVSKHVPTGYKALCACTCVPPR